MGFCYLFRKKPFLAQPLALSGTYLYQSGLAFYSKQLLIGDYCNKQSNAMFLCLVCKCGVEVYSRLDVGKHLRSYVKSRDYSVAFPLWCSQNDCASVFEEHDGYVKHFHRIIKHRNVLYGYIQHKPSLH